MCEREKDQSCDTIPIFIHLRIQLALQNYAICNFEFANGEKIDINNNIVRLK